MDKIFETLLFNRKILVNILDELSVDQLVKIPSKYNNSVVWNVGHILVTEQLLSYKNSGLTVEFENAFVKKYCKGSQATENVTEVEIKFIKDRLISSISKTQKDYSNKLFKQYHSYLTSTGISLNSIEEALKYNTFHEGIHLGVILSIKKFL